MRQKNVVSEQKWRADRLALLAEEKAFTRAREALTAKRQALPWVKLRKSYVFEGEHGPVDLDDLFEGRSQLIVYHLMFNPSWDAACKSCSFWADGFDRAIVHLKARDVSFACTSRAPLEKLLAYRQRMGWGFTWVSSGGNSFSRDFGVHFTPEEIESGEFEYNYRKASFRGGEDAPGFSVFARDDEGRIFHTYSAYSRGIEMLNPAYHLLDLVPKGRDEGDMPYTMAWLRRRDEYEQ
jgi:predicted dithiol-disulfide oxidoreductase (DUF899 family)